MIQARRDLSATGVTLEAAQRAAKLERKGKEDAEARLRDLQVQLSTKEAKASVSHQHHEATKIQLSDLENELKELKDSIPTIEAHAVEDFCGCEGPFMRILDSFVTGFYKCKELALQRLDDLENLEVPLKIEVTLELEAKITEKRPDALAILQLIKAEEPDVLAKWETRLLSPSGTRNKEEDQSQD